MVLGYFPDIPDLSSEARGKTTSKSLNYKRNKSLKRNRYLCLEFKILVTAETASLCFSENINTVPVALNCFLKGSPQIFFKESPVLSVNKNKYGGW